MRTSLVRNTFYLILFLFIFISCDNGLDDVEVPGADNEYLVTTELHKSYSQTDINSFITLAMLLYPDQKENLEQIKANVGTGVTVYKIVYNTEFNGEKLQASGLVCLPDEAGTYPILSYQNGTNTEHSKAPTLAPDDKLFQILEIMGSTGFIITLPDYLGFGESDDMFHPYLHKESTVQAVMDMIHAVEEMVEGNKDIEFNKELYITGYSQGGWATMCLQNAIETQYSAEFDLKASACGAGPYNLTTINQYVTDLTNYPMPYFLGYIFNSYLELEMTTAIDEVLKQPYAGLVPVLYDGTKSGGEINDQLTTSMSDFFTESYLTGWSSDTKFESLTSMLEDNSIAAYTTKVPTLLLHGTDDDLVPPVISTNIYADFIEAGVNPELVTLVPLAGQNHTSGIIPSGLASITWFLQLKEASN